MSAAALRDELPIRSRLALAYAPAHLTDSWSGFLALDARLAGIVRASREPVLAQLRLAWWRDRLGDDPARWPEGEPVLAALRGWRGDRSSLVALVDGWEELLGDAPLPEAALMAFADGRARSIAALAGGDGAGLESARKWALADLAMHVSDPQEQAMIRAAADNIAITSNQLPRSLRPLAVLRCLAARDLRSGKNIDRISPLGLLAAIRTGLFGR